MDPVGASTWEDYYVVKERFSKAIAGGQASSPGGGDVTTGASASMQEA